MADNLSQCSCVIDTSGLHAIATSSGNLQSIILNKLNEGVIGVPTCAWQEFQELYEHEAALVAPYVSAKITMKRAIYVGAARITERLNSGFSRGPYDNHTELYTASIASIEGYRVLTSADQIGEYEKMECDVSDLETWIEELENNGS
jgi:hypothetical protein